MATYPLLEPTKFPMRLNDQGQKASASPLTQKNTKAMVEVESQATTLIHPDNIDKIICHRHRQFLVRWKFEQGLLPEYLVPHSWHSIQELRGDTNTPSCLAHVQDYIQSAVYSQQSANTLSLPVYSSLNKRKQSPISESEIGSFRPRRTPPYSSTSSASGHDPIIISDDSDSGDHNDVSFDSKATYNCSLIFIKGTISAIPIEEDDVDCSCLPTPSMKLRAQSVSVEWAEHIIQNEFKLKLRLHSKHLPKVRLVNIIDNSTPPLRFQFISEYVYLRQDLEPDEGTIIGCTSCRPNMANHVGCEYASKCECLEYVEVQTDMIKDITQLARYEQVMEEGGSTRGFPKKFPYKRTGILQYRTLLSRGAIFECNDRCSCGPNCKTRVTQEGRQVRLEIFKTPNKGWALRSTEDIIQGQFIDFYYGEVLDTEEADRRQNVGGSLKDNYLFDLDKFEDQLAGMPLLVVDGEYMSGPTRFINHSCEPNCAQYAVSYNRNDPRRYNLAFFALEDIPTGEELTFDYTDSLDDESEEQQADGVPSASQGSTGAGKTRIPCHCGAETCRKWLWT